MRKQSFLIPVITGIFISVITGISILLAGCSSATFIVATGSSDASLDGTANDEPPIDVKNLDAGPNISETASPLVCGPYSCEPGCGECDKDAGMGCGNAGSHVCGSQNCMRYSAGADGGFSCGTEGLPSLFRCGGSVIDFLPGCIYSGTSTSYRWYCCK